jgi:C4-type Zn-finger protein
MGMDSYCMNCGDNGKTNLLFTRIPFFRNVIIMAFHCRHCGFRSSEVQSAEIQDKGTRFELTVSKQTVRLRLSPVPWFHGVIVPVCGTGRI